VSVTWVNRGTLISIWALLAASISLAAVPAYGIKAARRAEAAGQVVSDQPAREVVRQSTTQQSSRDAPTLSGVEARADSIAALSAFVLVAQREGDFPSLLNSLSEKRRESRALQDEMLQLMDEMDPQLARRGGDLAAFLVEPPNLLQPREAQQALRVVLPFIQTIPESLSTFGTFCLAAGLMLREDGQHALAGRYFEKASRTCFPLAWQALYLAAESAGKSHEVNRLLELEKRLEDPTAPDYLRRRARLVAGLALFEAGRDSKAEELLGSLLKVDLTLGDRTKVAAALGRLYEARGEHGRAARSYAQAFETGTSSQEAVEASRAYLRLLRDGKTSEDVSKTLSAARCFVGAGLRSEARPVLERLFHHGEQRLEAGWELGRLHYRMKNYREAVKVFRALEKLEKRATSSQRASLWIARCERQLSRTDVAIELFRRAALVGKHVTYLEAAWELALELESLGRLKEAAETYELLHRQFPETPLGQEAIWRKGLCQYRLGSIREAQSTFASVLKDKAEGSSHDMALFWMLKCSVEGGIPVPSGELAKERARSDSLYGVLLQGILRMARGDSLSGENIGTGKRVRKEMFKIPWIDWHLGEKDSASRAQASRTLDASSLSLPNLVELGFPEGLPPEAERGALLLKFGLRDLALDELRACEKRFSGDGGTLFLIAQLYWRSGLYRQAVSLSDRLLRGYEGLDETEKRFLERILYPVCYADVLLTEGRAQAVDPFLALAVMKRESTFDPAVLSPAGATGLMQLMPETANAIAAYLGEDKRKLDLRDPELNIRYGIWHLGRLMGKYSDSVVTALAAYNAGEDYAEKWTVAASSADGFVYMESVSFRETREYIRRVLADFQKYRELYAR
jgi:soluble lytic murein transglycosylase